MQVYILIRRYICGYTLFANVPMLGINELKKMWMKFIIKPITKAHDDFKMNIYNIKYNVYTVWNDSLITNTIKTYI